MTKKYAVFDGRARRTEYWMFALINLIVFRCPEHPLVNNGPDPKEATAY